MGHKKKSWFCKHSISWILISCGPPRERMVLSLLFLWHGFLLSPLVRLKIYHTNYPYLSFRRFICILPSTINMIQHFSSLQNLKFRCRNNNKQPFAESSKWTFPYMCMEMYSVTSLKNVTAALKHFLLHSEQRDSSIVCHFTWSCISKVCNLFVSESKV